MTLKVADRVRENTSSTGVGGLSLTGAPTGFQTFDSVLSSGDTTFYALEENDKFEIGIGTYGSNNLERTTILASSSAGSKISLGGSGSVFITYPAEKAAFITDVTSVSGIAAYASGLAQSGGGDVTTAQLQYVSGIAVYGSGQASNIATNTSNISTNTSNISTNSSNIVATSGIANYASGIAGQNESDVVAVSGIANYASGGSNFTAGSGLALVGSEFNMSGTGRLQELQIKSSSSTPQIVFTGSGAVSSINAKAKTDDGSFSPSGTSISFEGSEGQLLNITDNLSSGNIFSVSNISGLPLFEIDASGDVKIARRGRYVGVGSGVPEYGLDVSASGRIQKGVVLSNYVPAVTTNTLYNDGGAISWNGSALGGDVSSSQLTYVSGIAVYASGKANDVSDVANYASGQAISNQSSISTNQTNIAAISGVAYNTFSISASDSSNYTINGMGLNNALDPDIYLHKGHTYYFNKLNISHPFRISASDGGAVYQDADGNNIEISGQGTLKFEVPQDAPDKLYYYCTSHSSAMKGEIYTTNNVDELTYASGIAAYASGQAIANEGDIVAVSGIAVYSSGQVNVTTDGTAEGSKALVLDSAKSFTGVKDGRFSQFDSFVYSSGVSVGNSGVVLARNTPGVTTDTLYNIGGALYFNGSQLASAGASAEASYASGQAIENESDIAALLTASGTATSLISSSGIASYASGQAIENEGDLVAVSGIAAYASGVSLTVKESDGSPNVSNVRTIVVSNGTLTDNGAGQVTVTTGGGGGGGDVTTAQLNYVSGIAVYSSGQAISNQSNITALNTASGIATSLLAVSGTATSLVASSGIATYASGKAIANEGDIVATSGIANYASGQAISNQGNITALNTASGIATSLLAVSGTATSLVASSGIATYASGQAISNQGNITALLSASGTATSLIASSGIATYASGQAISNQTNITSNTSNISYVSGVATNKFTVTASDSNNYTFNGMGLSNGLDPDLYLHKGHTYYFDKQTASHPFRVSATDGGSVYQDAAGNNIEISGQGVLKFEVPQNAPDKLYYYCTSHASNMKGEIYTTNNVDEIIHVSGIAAYASGQAISNQSNITALNTASGIATSLLAVSGTATSLIASSGIATYASGQAIANESDIAALLTASGTATSLIASSGIATYASGNTANISFGSNAEGDILIHDGSKFTRLAKGTDNYILKMNGNLPNWEAESGGSSLTAGSGVVVDGADRINIHSGTGNFQEIELTSANTFTPKMVFTGSGVQDTPVTMKVLSSHAAVNTSGTALSFEGTQGQLFAITDNLSSGNIFSVADITGLPLISVDASGDVKLAEHGRYILAYGGYVQESVPASDTPTTEDATITLDLSTGNYHNVVLGADVTKFEFLNAKRGQRFLLRITQHASSAKTIAWTNVDYTSGGAAGTVRWAGGGTAPTMSTSTSHTDVYGFLCTNDAGSAFDGFVIGQDLPD